VQAPELSPSPDTERERKLLAWWEGYDPDSSKDRSPASADTRPAPIALPRPPATSTIRPAPPSALDRAVEAELRSIESRQLGRSGAPVWSVERVCGAERLWGSGYTGPGDAAWIRDATRPFRLCPEKAVLDLTAALGGSAKAIVMAYGSLVTGLESSPLLSHLGAHHCDEPRLRDKITVAWYDPNDLQHSRRYDLVMADTLLYRLADKGKFLKGVAHCLKPGGALLLHDFFLSGHTPQPQLIDAWHDGEPVRIHPCTAKALVQEFPRHGLAVCGTQDMTAVYRRLIVQQARQLALTLDSAPAPPRTRSGLATELSLWRARVQALGHGLSFCRIAAVKQA